MLLATFLKHGSVIYSVSIKYGINSVTIQPPIIQKNARTNMLLFLNVHFLRKKLNIQGVPKLRYDLRVGICKWETPFFSSSGYFSCSISYVDIQLFSRK